MATKARARKTNGRLPPAREAIVRAEPIMGPAYIKAEISKLQANLTDMQDALKMAKNALSALQGLRAKGIADGEEQQHAVSLSISSWQPSLRPMFSSPRT